MSSGMQPDKFMMALRCTFEHLGRRLCPVYVGCERNLIQPRAGPSAYFVSGCARQSDQVEIGDHVPVPSFQDFIANDARVLACPSEQDLGLASFVNGAALANDFLGHRGRMAPRKDARLIYLNPESGRPGISSPPQSPRLPRRSSSIAARICR